MEIERSNFLLMQLQHMMALTQIVENDQFEEDLLLIESALLQTQPKCDLKICIMSMYITIHDEKVILHKTIGFPEQKKYQEITCSPISQEFIPDFHGKIGFFTSQGKLTIDDTKIQEQMLKNNTFLENNSRRIKILK